MSSSADAEGSEDVNDFLLRIRELGEKRDKEDEERTRKLEEEILQGRKERQARRAERARSISPTKDSPSILDNARLSTSSFSLRAIDPPEQLEPTPRTPERDISSKSEAIPDDESVTTNGSRRGSRVEINELESSPKAPSVSLRSRAGTLSWQQRPSSRELNRPFFSTSPVRENRLRAMSSTSIDDRGLSGSPTLRSPPTKEAPLDQAEKNASSPMRTVTVEEKLQDLSTQDKDPKASEIEPESTHELEKESSQPEVGEIRSRSPSRASSTFAESSLGHRYSSVSSVSTATGLGSPVPLSSAQKLEPRKTEADPEDQTTTPLSPRRLSPERSTSPTKGLGGFVQSAMMKRSDSVSKRWSAQLPSGLSRGHSFAGNRNSFAAPSKNDLLSSPRLTPDSSTLTTHRPGSSHRPSSSHSEATIIKESERPATPPVSSGNDTIRPEWSPGRPQLALHTRSASALENNDSSSLPATSPVVSRTMDPKRWSPTKSTWLESALNRPDSPRHKKQPSQSTTWNRERQSRGSIDMGRSNTFKEVTPVGLMRTAAPGSHSKTSSVSGMPDLFGTTDTANKVKEAPAETTAPDTEGNNIQSAEKSSTDPSKTAETVPESTDQITEPTTTRRKRAPTLLTPTSNASFDSPISPTRISPTRDPLLNRPKPQSPVIDFRANLRKREVVKDQGPKEEPEFKNVFGKLKKTESSNYVPPDKLKDNILRGKAALNATGGPKKTQKVDELKESILKQREAIKSSGGSMRRNTVGENDAPMKVVPEAIAKRQNLTKSSSAKSNVSDTPVSLSPREPGTPQLSPQLPSELEHSPSPQLATEEHNADAPNTQEQAPEPDHPISEQNSKNEPNESKDQLEDAVIGEREKSSEEAIQPVRALPSGNVVQATNPPASTEGLATKGKLAGRINPALAGLLSRGPPATVNGSNNALLVNDTVSSAPSPATATLTHMTKNRARGPKRRLPNPVASEAVDPPSKEATESYETPDFPDISEPEDWDCAAEEPNPREDLLSSKVEEKKDPVKDFGAKTERATWDVSSPPDEETGAFIKDLVPKTETPSHGVPPSLDIEVDASMDLAQKKEPSLEEPLQFSDIKGDQLPTVDSAPQEKPDSQETPRFSTSMGNEAPTVVSVLNEEEIISPEPVLPVINEGTVSENCTSKRDTISRLTMSPDTRESETMNPVSKEDTVVEQIPPPSEIEGHEPIGSLESEKADSPKSLLSPSIMRSDVSSTGPVLEKETESQATAASPDIKEPGTSPSPTQSPVGNSSGWPLPDGDIPAPAASETGLAQPSPSTIGKPIEFKRNIPHMAERDSKQNFGAIQSKPATEFEKLTQKFEEAHGDVEHRRDSFKPVPPPKAAPSTPTPEFRQSRSSPIHFSSPSPSPLRSSFKQNQIYPSPTAYRRTAPGMSPSSPRDKSLPSPPVPPKSSPSLDQVSSRRSSASLVPQADESLEAISGFFMTFPNPRDSVNIDAQLMLTSKNENQKIRTLRKQMWEITGDGKKQDLPVNQEYILYEGSMYLCVHLFEADGGARSETHLWCGDDVPDAAIDDAQSFSKKVAKENGCKLEVIKQGKETARFIQALGGILITRRGLSSRSSSSAFFMLCGRKHLGQMVFDEVNFSRQSLCPGYPFVISAMFGKVYLWKGKGSAAEEVGAARLIGMDLGLTGEFEEVAEEEEPESFFECFPQYGESEDYMRPDYWRLKPNHACYRPRLLRIDHELGQQRPTGFWLRRPGSASPVIRPNDTVQEIEPFCQKDIKTNGIYVLDTFFEIYVIVGEQASNRPADFVSAVVFAHEYGILAASLQDRPFIPKSFVSLGGVPGRCCTAFRKWEQPTLRMPPQVFPLNAAIEAIRS
ncbi:gelsolin repeat protein [Aspergillus flavus]|nr:gelsolin repeat protein [Aspergillus flavus]RAQ65902.1 gelsolin repeat protein [Aspergillus flavus]